MKHGKFGFLHLICGKHGSKKGRKLSAELAYQSNDEAYMFGVTFRLLFCFVGAAIEIEKKREEPW